MKKIEYCLRQIKFCHFSSLLLVGLPGCGAMDLMNGEGKVYHCVARDMPISTPNKSVKDQPLERFEYGDYIRTDRVSTGHETYCNFLRVPETAYLRYRYEGNVLEKRFDLSTLDPWRLYKKTVEFYVDGDIVEVRLVTPVHGNWPIKKVIVRQ